MKLDKFLGSKTKSDILKYLIFRRQGVSMRAMSNDIAWTFPAIKKQIDSLEESEIIMIERDNNKFYIILNPEIADVVKNLYTVGIKMDMITCFEQYCQDIEQFYFGKLFGSNSDIDLVLVYYENNPNHIEQLKTHINEILRSYFIETASIVFLSNDERNRRYRLADKFVLSIIRNTIKGPILHFPKKLKKPPLIIDQVDEGGGATNINQTVNGNTIGSNSCIHKKSHQGIDPLAKGDSYSFNTTVDKPVQTQLL